MDDDGEGCSRWVNEANVSSTDLEEMSQYMEDERDNSVDEVDNIEDASESHVNALGSLEDEYINDATEMDSIEDDEYMSEANEMDGVEDGSESGFNESESPEDEYVSDVNEMESLQDDFQGAGDEDDGYASEEENEGNVSEHDMGTLDVDEQRSVDSTREIYRLDLKNLTLESIIQFDFATLELGYLFYKWYSRMNGFAVRKGKIVKSSGGEILQQIFHCNKEGYRRDNGLTKENRKRAEKCETRGGCKAEMRVHVHLDSGRWYVKSFQAAHNHELVEDPFHGFQAAHRSMSEGHQMQMNNYRKAGVDPPQVYAILARQSGGYDKLTYDKKYLYNIMGKQRRAAGDDSKAALDYLRWLKLKDPLIFNRHVEGPGKKIQHLFWADGLCQMSYNLFGDVLAFDATYSQNQYRRPVVVFSGVNHHNNSTIFGCAIISNETEDTYVWLLEQFNEAMKGKTPSAIITDGCKAMRNAIKRVYPKCHHRLCAWHLLECAHKNLKNPDFNSEFKKCMLGDYEVGQFEKMWKAMVTRFGYEDNCWVNDLYEKKENWAACYMRGKFFAGFRTTSRCEGMHSQIGRYVNTRTSLTEFVEQFQRALAYIRSREVEADFKSIHGGETVLQTSLRGLERSAANVLTRELFILFRLVLNKSILMYVGGVRETATSIIYTIKKSRLRDREWYVSVYPSTYEFRCSCMRMESFGLPCDHIVRVLLVLGIDELPKSLVLSRWSKGAKDGVRAMHGESSYFWDSEVTARYVSLIDVYMELSTAASKNVTHYNNQYDKAMCDLKAIINSSTLEGDNDNATGDGNLRDDNVVQRKQKGGRPSTKRLKSKRSIKCGLCRVEGHNRLSCPLREKVAEMTENMYRTRAVDEDEEHEVETFQVLEVLDNLIRPWMGENGCKGQVSCEE